MELVVYGDGFIWIRDGFIRIWFDMGMVLNEDGLVWSCFERS